MSEISAGGLHPSIVALVSLAANIAVVESAGACCTPTQSGQACC